MHIIGRQNGHVMRPRQRIKLVNPCPVITAVKITGSNMPQRRQSAFQATQASAEMIHAVAGNHDQLNVLAVFCQIIQRDIAHPLGLPCPAHIMHLAFRKQHAKLPVSRTIFRISKEFLARHQL